MKTIKELEAEYKYLNCHICKGQLIALKDVLGLIDDEISYIKLIINSRIEDELPYDAEYAILKKLEELKARITG